MFNSYKLSRQMSGLGQYIYWFSAYESILWENGRVTIHCKSDRDFEIVKTITRDKDVYALQVRDSFSIFVKGWDKQ